MGDNESLCAADLRLQFRKRTTYLKGSERGPLSYRTSVSPERANGASSERESPFYYNQDDIR